jgi:hypothetical protein
MAIEPAMTMGMLTRKMEPHQKFSSSSPPVTGPMATASPADAAHSPIAFGRSLRGNTLVMIARVAGTTRAAPIPIPPRAAMSSSALRA